jgi:hypothetical protein
LFDCTIQECESLLKRFFRVIAAVICAGWVCAGHAYTYNPIGDTFWDDPVLSSMPDEWKALISESHARQQPGASATSKFISGTSPSPVCTGGKKCASSSPAADFSNGVDLIHN